MQHTIRVLAFFQRPSMRDGGPVLHDWVRYAPIHAVQTVVNEERVDRLRPNEKLLMNDDAGIRSSAIRMRWAEIEPAYEAWKSGNEIPESGTPLGVWPGIAPEQATALKMSAIRTVEEVASLPDHVIGKIHLPNMREMRMQAKAFLEARGAQDVAAGMARRDEEVASLREQLDEALKLLGDLTNPGADHEAKNPRVRRAKASEVLAGAEGAA